MKTIINKTNLSILFLVLTFIPFLSAVQIDSDTLFNTTTSNLTINFTDTRYADVITVNANWIEFQGYRLIDSSNEKITFNLTETNKFYNHTSLPYFSDSDYLEKTISSNLTTQLNSTISIAASCNYIGTITYISDYLSYSNNWIKGEYSCSGDTITFTNLPIDNSSTNVFTLFYNGGVQDGCQNVVGGFLSGSAFLSVVIVLFFAVVVLGFLFSNFSEESNTNGNLDPKAMMGMIITVIVVGVILIVGTLIVSSIGGC